MGFVIEIVLLNVAPRLLDGLMLYPAQVVNDLYLWQLLTHGFLHSWDSLFHLLMNALMIFLLGRLVNQFYGNLRTWLVFLVAILFGGAAFVLWGYLWGTPLTPGLGASGGAFGILALACMTWPNMSISLMFIVPIKAKYLFWFFFGLETLMAFSPTSGTAHMAHIGGALVGLVYARWGKRLESVMGVDATGTYGGSRFWGGGGGDFDMGGGRTGMGFANPVSRDNEKTSKAHIKFQKKRQKLAEKEQGVRAEMDRILAKISDKGIPALSAKEKRFLNENSKRYGPN